jgi:UDP-N-acetylenolpyruvoylglucosamine reductase
LTAISFRSARVIRCRDSASTSREQGLSGIEGLGGIPGTVGGALWMNAGAYGHEIGTVTETVRVAREGKLLNSRREYSVELPAHFVSRR